MIVNDEWYPDPYVDVSCGMSDLRWFVYAAIGAVVIAGAVGLAIVRRISQ